MIRRIPCTVVRCVPLSKSDADIRHGRTSDRREVLQHVGQPNSPPRRTETGCVVNVNVRVRSSIDSFTYTNRLDIPKATIDYRPAGQILDCYV